MPSNSYSSFFIPAPPPPPPPPPAQPPAAQQPPPPPPPLPKVELPPPPPPVKVVAPAPVLSPPPAAAPYPVVEAEVPPANLFFAVMKRWPWLVVGLAAGLVVGFLVYLQRPPAYQSYSQLLVIKNRPEMSGSAAGDSRVQYVEDYVATQVTLLKSEAILEQAAKRLDEQRPFQVPPPEKERDRIAFLASRFGVGREREPGTNTPSNVLALTFRAPHPADAPKYLHAIIKAYQTELSSLYEEATVSRLAALQNEITTFENQRSKHEQAMTEAKRDLNKISQEDLTGLRGRITTNRGTEGTLKLKERSLKHDIKIAKGAAGRPRQQRLTVMEALGVRVERTGTGLNSTNPEETLLALQLQRDEMARKFGPEHPDMISLEGRIKLVTDAIGKDGTGGAKGDELDRHLARMESELEAVSDQLANLDSSLQSDEKKATGMGEAQNRIDIERNSVNRLNDRINERVLEKNQLTGAKNAGGYKVKAITQPADGALVAPVLREWLLLGGVLGLMFGGGLGLVAELSDRGFRSPAEIRRRLGVPVLGHVPRLRTELPPENNSVAGLDKSVVTFLRPSSNEAEAYRGVRTQLSFSPQGRGHSVIQVTSPNPGDGKSTLAANLAVALAQSGKRVILMDCDFRKPRVHVLFSVPKPEVGLASVMAGDATLAEATKESGVPGLHLLPCGPRPANPGELLTLPKFQELLAELKAAYDFVIVDTPPVLAVADPTVVAPRVDGVLMVFRMSKDARPQAERAKEQLSAVGARVLGVIVNASTARSAGYGGYGYSYKYTEHYTENYGEADAAPAKPLPKKG